MIERPRIIFSTPIPRCRLCGAELPEAAGTETCETCAPKSQRFAKGKWCLVVIDPTPYHPFLGSHFKREEVRCMLVEGLAVEGWVCEVWQEGRYIETVVVVGEEEKPQELMVLDDWKPKGDGRFWVPGMPPKRKRHYGGWMEGRTVVE